MVWCAHTHMVKRGAEPLSEARNAHCERDFFLNGDLNVREADAGGSFVLFSAAVKKVCSLC